MILAALGAEVDHLRIVENDPANPVAGRKSAPRAKRGQFRSDDRFHRSLASEEHRGSLVHNQQHGPLALLVVDANVGLTQPGRGAPIDRSNVISSHVSSKFFKAQASSPQPRVMSAGQERADGLTWQ